MTQNFSFAQSTETAGRFVLSIRLWKAANGPAEEISWQSPPPVAALALDLVHACQCEALTTLDFGLNVSFPGLTAAVLAARRLQWAVAGLAQSANDHGPAAAMLIQIASDSEKQARSLPEALQAASPGQILLESSASRLLGSMPGLTFRGDEKEDFDQLEWWSSGNPDGAAEDEAVLRQTLRERGIADPADSLTHRNATVTAGRSAASLTPQPPAAEPRSPQPAELRSAWLKEPAIKSWHYATAAAVLLVLLVALIFSLSHKTPPGTAKAPLTGTAVVPSPQPTPTPGANPHPSQPHSPQPTTPSHVSQAPTPGKKGREPKPAQTADTSATTAAKPSMGECFLNSSEVPAALDEASASLQNGRYADSERKFRSVLACDPSNTRALRGYERARAGLELHPSAPKP